MIPVNRLIHRSQLAYYFVCKALYRLMSLRFCRIRQFYFHFLALEDDTVPKHLSGQVFVKVSVGSAYVLGSAALGDMRCAIWLRKEVVLFAFCCLIISNKWRRKSIDSFELFRGRALVFRILWFVVHFGHPFVNIEVIVVILLGLATLHNERVVNVLQVGTDCNFVLLVVLVYHVLIAAHWSIRNTCFFV